jgi:hypothetical protein
MIKRVSIPRSCTEHHAESRRIHDMEGAGGQGPMQAYLLFYFVILLHATRYQICLEVNVREIRHQKAEKVLSPSVWYEWPGLGCQQRKPHALCPETAIAGCTNRGSSDRRDAGAQGPLRDGSLTAAGKPASSSAHQDDALLRPLITGAVRLTANSLCSSSRLLTHGMAQEMKTATP